MLLTPPYSSVDLPGFVFMPPRILIVLEPRQGRLIWPIILVANRAPHIRRLEGQLEVCKCSWFHLPVLFVFRPVGWPREHVKCPCRNSRHTCLCNHVNACACIQGHSRIFMCGSEYTVLYVLPRLPRVVVRIARCSKFFPILRHPRSSGSRWSVLTILNDNIWRRLCKFDRKSMCHAFAEASVGFVTSCLNTNTLNKARPMYMNPSQRTLTLNDLVRAHRCCIRA